MVVSGLEDWSGGGWEGLQFGCCRDADEEGQEARVGGIEWGREEERLDMPRRCVGCMTGKVEEEAKGEGGTRKTEGSLSGRVSESVEYGGMEGMMRGRRGLLSDRISGGGTPRTARMELRVGGVGGKWVSGAVCGRAPAGLVWGQCRGAELGDSTTVRCVYWVTRCAPAGRCGGKQCGFGWNRGRGLGNGKRGGMSWILVCMGDRVGNGGGKWRGGGDGMFYLSRAGVGAVVCLAEWMVAKRNRVQTWGRGGVGYGYRGWVSERDWGDVGIDSRGWRR